VRRAGAEVEDVTALRMQVHGGGPGMQEAGARTFASLANLPLAPATVTSV